MSNVFEDGLADFIRSLANNQGKGGASNFVKEENVQQRTNPKHKTTVHAPGLYDEGPEQQDELEHVKCEKISQDCSEAHVDEEKIRKRKYVHKGLRGATASKKKSKVNESTTTDNVHLHEDGAKNIAEEKSLQDEITEDVIHNSEVRDTIITEHVQSAKDNTSADYEQKLVSPTTTDGVASRVVCERDDALKHLQFYGTGS